MAIIQMVTVVFVVLCYTCSCHAHAHAHALASSAPAPARRVVMEPDVVSRTHMNSNRSRWRIGDRTPADTILFFTMALNVPSESQRTLNRVFRRVSSPSHPDYGRYWSRAEVSALLQPREHHLSAVRKFLDKHGISMKTDVAFHNNLLSFAMDAASAESAFETRFYEFHHRHHTHVTLHRAALHKGYSLPPDVAEAVASVDGITRLPQLRQRQQPQPSFGDDTISHPFPSNTCGGKCAGLITPAILTDRYQLGDAPADNTCNNSMAVAEFQDQGWKQGDMDKMTEACHLNHNITVNRQIGGPPYGGPSAEASLDITYIKSLGGAIPLTNIYSEPYSLLHWAQVVGNLSSPPLVHSVSYGNDEQQQSGASYMDACNLQFQALGVRGLSLLFASGDQGVCGREGCGIFGGGAFNPGFPAASPFVTSVGGTDFATKSVIGEETAWDRSGGGFSNTFAIPSYQADAIAAYLKSCPNLNCPPAKDWNATGRGFPDVAALGGAVNKYCVNLENSFGGVDGTSAATPVVAAIFAKLNDLRLRAGKPPMGFLNPFIYANPTAFNDVTTGCNNNGGKYGFTATKGWDPATGLGTPNYALLKKLV